MGESCSMEALTKQVAALVPAQLKSRLELLQTCGHDIVVAPFFIRAPTTSKPEVAAT